MKQIGGNGAEGIVSSGFPVIARSDSDEAIHRAASVRMDRFAPRNDDRQTVETPEKYGFLFFHVRQ
jgi:hypothetical protein